MRGDLVSKKLKHNNYINFWPYINSIHTVDLIRHIGGEVKYQSFYKQDLIPHTIV